MWVERDKTEMPSTASNSGRKSIRDFAKVLGYADFRNFQSVIETCHPTDLAANPGFSTKDFRVVPAKYRALFPDDIKDYVGLNPFAA